MEQQKQESPGYNGPDRADETSEEGYAEIQKICRDRLARRKAARAQQQKSKESNPSTSR